VKTGESIAPCWHCSEELQNRSSCKLHITLICSSIQKCYLICKTVINVSLFLCLDSLYFHHINITESQNRWGWRNLWRHLVQPSRSNKDTKSRVTRTISGQLLNISKEGDSTASVGSLCHCLIKDCYQTMLPSLNIIFMTYEELLFDSLYYILREQKVYMI